MTFLKIYLGKCWQKYFFSYFSQLWLASPFFNKRNFCQTKKFIYTYFDAMAEMAFWNIFLYCKIIIAFLEPFSAASFQCILQTHWTRRNTSIPKILENVNTWLSWWRHHMMAKWHLSIFLSRLIPYCQYSICKKFHVKRTKTTQRFSKKPSPGTAKPSFNIYLRYQEGYLRYSVGLPLLNPMRRCSFYAGVTALVTYQCSWTEVGRVIKHRIALFSSCYPDKCKTSRR